MNKAIFQDNFKGLKESLKVGMHVLHAGTLGSLALHIPFSTM